MEVKMKGKFLNTKNVVIGLVSLVLIGASATGVTIFLKNRGQAEAAGEQVQNLPATGREEQDNNQTNTNPGTVEDPNNQGNNTEIPGAPVEPTTPNTNPGTTTPNQTTGGTTTNPGGNNTTTGIEETVRIERQKVFEDLQLSWTTIGIPAITANMGIFKPELQIEKTATAVIREGEAEQIPVMKENKPMVRAGDTIIYTIQVSNLGNYKATNVVVTDSLDVIFDGKKVPANEELAKIETLEAGKVATLKVGYIVKQADIDAVIETEQNEIIPKDIINIATATDGKTTVEDDDDMPVNPDVTINVNKNWQDNDNQDGKRPEKIKVELYRNNENEPVETVTIDASSDWKYVFSKLPKYDEDKNEITYRVVEETVPEYDTEYEISDNGVEIYNHHTPEKVSVEGSKTWDDADNQDGKRPESITVRLFADGTEVTSKTVTANDNWKWSFTDLDKYNSGTEIVYTISEDTVADYTTVVDGYNITNTHTPEKISISGSKTWDDADNQDGKRPESITVRLFADGTEVTSKTVTANDNWSWSFTGLDKYNSGTEIVYTISEDTVADYTTVVNGYDVTNTHTPEKTTITGSKTWDDADNQDGKRPSSITVRLLADGRVVSHKKITEKDNWSWNFEDLPVYEKGEKITYTIKEDSVENYETKLDGYNIINTHKTETTSVSGTKTWNDNNNQDGVRPDSITVELLKTVNGTTTSMGENYKQVLTGNKLDYSWSNLPVYEAGERITYTVKEAGEKDGKIVGKNGEKYTVEYDSTGMNITNTYTPKTTSVSGTKTWVDYDNKYNSRPESITINLLANGGKVDSKTITPQNDSWTYKFEDLPVYKNGQKITYTISEDTVSGYKSKVTGYNVTNTYTEAPKGTITMNWDTQSTTESPIPVDVVFVLDTSWSMIDKGSSRGTNMVEAVNNAIDEILRFNTNNRISVVGYSEYGVLSNLKVPYNNKEHSSVLLPLGRYTANDGKNYLNKSENRIETNIKGEAKKTRYFEAGTFTQAGIQKGAEQLINSTGKTVKVDGKDVQRVPVIIVVSDGEPTVFSTNYTSPLSGKVLGTSQLKNTSAVYGYYTILTANYYKQQVAKAYGTSAKVFTIAMDLTTQYGKTVLNPNNTNVRKCENWRETDTRNQIEDKEISQKLYKYLNNFNQDISASCSVGFQQDDKGNYINKAKYKNVTVVKNPYSNYSYADKAFANNDMTADDLQRAMIGSITETVSNKKTHDIDENDRKTGKAYLDKIDTTKDFKLEIAGGKTYTSYKEAENDKLVGFDGEKYYVDLTKLIGKTVTVNYRQK
jgi:uncharacterized repeat protein (TIGR01451 family)